MQGNLLKTKWWFVACALIFISSFCVYYPGLSGDYEFDDSVNILYNKVLKIDSFSISNVYQAAVSGGLAGPLHRPISMASFILNIYFTGFDPYYMKLTNVLIHCFNGVSMFLLTFLLLKAYCIFTDGESDKEFSQKNLFWLAFLTALAWSLHPMALTSVLYIVQRMTSLSGFFVIWALIGYVWGRLLMHEGRQGMVLIVFSLITGGAISLFCKESGALLPAYTFVIEWALFRFKTISKSQKQQLHILFIIILLIPAALIITWLLIHPHWLINGYLTRDFTLTERLLTESRVIWFYLYLILLPNISMMGLYHDDIVMSQTLLSPWTTLPALIALIILVATAFIIRKKHPVAAFGIFFFLVGHTLESTVIALEIAHEHRNYLPMYGILFATIYYISGININLRNQKIRVIITGIIIFLFAAATTVRASYWGNLLNHSLMEAENHPYSSRAQFQAGRIYWKLAMENPKNRKYFLDLAEQHLKETYKVSKVKNDTLIALIQLHYYSNKPMNPKWLPELEDSLRQNPVPSSTVSALYQFTLCETNKLCKLPPKSMRDIYSAILSNTTLVGRNRSNIFSMAAMYEANQQNFETAIKYLYHACKTASGDLDFRITLIDLLIKLNRFEEAKKQIAIIKREDKYLVYTSIIRKKEDMLTQYLSNPKPILQPNHNQ